METFILDTQKGYKLDEFVKMIETSTKEKSITLTFEPTNNNDVLVIVNKK